MKFHIVVGVCLFAANSLASAAGKCPAIETTMLNREFGDVAPWRVMSAGAGECSFMTANTSINFGFNHMVAEDADQAKAAAVEMREAVAGKSTIEALPVLGEEGFSYQPKNDAGKIDPNSMFFYGHRGSVNVGGYLNLKSPITPAQRDFAANLLASTLGVATNAKALEKETHCRYLDAKLVDRLLPTQERSAIAPDANSCIVSAAGKVITVGVTTNPQNRQAATNMMKTNGCKVDALPSLGTVAGISHHCSGGNPRAQVLFVAGTRMFDLTYVPTQEPTEDERATLVQLAEFAATH